MMHFGIRCHQRINLLFGTIFHKKKPFGLVVLQKVAQPKTMASIARNVCRPLKSIHRRSLASQKVFTLRAFSTEVDSGSEPEPAAEPVDDWVSKIKPGYSPHIPPQCDAWDLSCHTWQTNDRDNTLIS
jgi:hypothetical protein